MAARVPYTYRRSGGVYQARLCWPHSICVQFPDLSPELRFSLRTREPEEARKLVSEIVYMYRQVIEFIEENCFNDGVEAHKDLVSDLINKLVDPSGRRTLMHYLQSQSTPLQMPRHGPVIPPLPFEVTRFKGDIVESKTVIETLPDGTQRFFSDLTDPGAANREIAEFVSLLNPSMPAFGGSSGPGLLNKTVKEVAEEFTQMKIDDGDWSDPETLKNRQFRLDYIVDFLGSNKVFRSLTRQDGKKLREALLARSRLAKGELDRLSSHTSRKYLQLFCSLAEFALNEEYHSVDIGRKLTIKAKKSDEEPYLPFNKNDIAKLVKGFIYTSQEQKRAGSYPAAFFWVPLIGLYTGARLNEICQLLISDVQSRAGIWCLNLGDEEGDAEYGDQEVTAKKSQSFKTDSSRRVVPIHSAILDAGFLEYLEERKQSKNNQGRLFEDLTYDEKNKWGRKVGRWFNETYVPTLELGCPDKKVFHSLRHSVIKNLRQSRTKAEEIAALVGHEGKSTTSRYGNDISDETLVWLKELVELIDYGVPTDHILYCRFKEFQVCKGQPEKKAYLWRAWKSKHRL